jgi:hypothetical protein
MSRKILLSLAVFAGSLNLWCQVEPSATGGAGNSDDDSLMTLPPSVSGSFYPSETGDQYKENSLSGGILFTAAYDDNVLAGQATKPITAESYTILPNIALNTRTSRLNGSLRYSPGFVFYHPTSELNDVTQNAVADFSYRITPHTVVGVQESFQQNSTVFSGPYTAAGATISGSGTSALPIVLIPYGGEITDFTNGHIGYQFSRSSMISAAGFFSSFHFSGSALSEGLYNSNAGGGGVSYSRRLTRTQFIGASYGYSVSNISSFDTTTDNHTGSVFYNIDLGKAFSLSLTGGPEYSTTTTQGTAPTHTWAPSVNAGLGWQRKRANFALSYAHSITTGYGLLGSFTSDSASTTVGWQFTRRLTGNLNGSYSNTKSAASQLFAYTATGHSVFGRAALSYRLSERLNLVGEYTRLHQAYSAIGFISSDPDADRVAVSLNYGFTRPLGH